MGEDGGGAARTIQALRPLVFVTGAGKYLQLGHSPNEYEYRENGEYLQLRPRTRAACRTWSEVGRVYQNPSILIPTRSSPRPSQPLASHPFQHSWYAWYSQH